MKLFSTWGFNRESWKGQRGEYWVVAQAVLMLGYCLLPVYRPHWLVVSPPLLYGVWTIAALLALAGLILVSKGLLDLGINLTPLPYPREEGTLVQSGVYSVVRHPLYSGLLLAAKAWAIWQLSLTHLLGVLVGFLFFNLKAEREETWLTERYPDYVSYQQHVKKLIPWIY
ncbi:MAG TPA: isoprenylcysteine carboxylmethyltransferase family protein [Allocoleopsis sp.]